MNIHYDIEAARAEIIRNTTEAHATAFAQARPDMKPLVDAQVRLMKPAVDVTVTLMELQNEGLDPKLMESAMIFAGAHYMRLILQLENGGRQIERMLHAAIRIALDFQNTEGRAGASATVELPVIQGGRA